jgi:hypothetical protein
MGVAANGSSLVVLLLYRYVSFSKLDYTKRGTATLLANTFRGYYYKYG